MMSTGHRIYIFSLTAIAAAIVIAFGINGLSYYSIPIEERFFHPEHLQLKPAGTWGHGLGFLGSFSMILGIVIYMARKRFRFLSRYGPLKHWLEFHIFLCTVGPFMILYHTSFKFGGLVAISFWSMVAVFASGIIGRFIYIQIPRSIEGRELSLTEISGIREGLTEKLSSTGILGDQEIKDFFIEIREGKKNISHLRKLLSEHNIHGSERKEIIKLVKKDIELTRKIGRLVTMQNLFRYWHVAHLPFALVMIIIMIIHIGVALTFGYHWIF